MNHSSLARGRNDPFGTFIESLSSCPEASLDATNTGVVLLIEYASTASVKTSLEESLKEFIRVSGASNPALYVPSKVSYRVMVTSVLVSSNFRQIYTLSEIIIDIDNTV